MKTPLSTVRQVLRSASGQPKTPVTELPSFRKEDHQQIWFQYKTKSVLTRVSDWEGYLYSSEKYCASFGEKAWTCSKKRC